jgi:hypothetical protein
VRVKSVVESKVASGLLRAGYNRLLNRLVKRPQRNGIQNNDDECPNYETIKFHDQEDSAVTNVPPHERIDSHLFRSGDETEVLSCSRMELSDNRLWVTHKHKSATSIVLWNVDEDTIPHANFILAIASRCCE